MWRRLRRGVQTAAAVMLLAGVVSCAGSQPSPLGTTVAAPSSSTAASQLTPTSDDQDTPEAPGQSAPTATALPTASPLPDLAPASPTARQAEPAPTKVVTEVPADQSASPVDPSLEGLTARARQDLATRLGIGVGDIVVIDALTVTWPDRGLGCPQPGMGYLQVQVEGVLIRFRAAGLVYEYHGGGGREPFLCQNPLSTPPAGSAPSSGAGAQ